MSKPIIKVENLSKAYQIGQIGTGTISKDIDRFWQTKILGKEDPFLKIGETNDRSIKGESDIVWSLKDINFEINQGDAVGIIGKNGAGKSTLLKLLSRVTSPTTGEIRVKGRIASLLEVGTGFHPELSGRENIYLNGAILGMRKKEITRKLDEIIDFSGVERYIDTPVKRYSSGMYVRLAFAVAAHLESEILIVDEVLAVGDAEFQKKCLGKMGEISKGEGRTVLFVSHNMGALRQICHKGIFLENGKMLYSGEINEAVSKYLDSSHKSLEFSLPNNLELPICITRVRLNSNGKELIDINDRIEIELEYFVNQPLNQNSIAVRLQRENTVVCLNFIEVDNDKIIDKEKGRYSTVMKNFPKRLLKAGTYSFDFYAGIIRTKPIQSLENAIVFDIDVLGENNHDSVFAKDRAGIIGVDLDWMTQSLQE
ncbi:MAG: polysaccharide ABC transporter ATP-binding protein [Flavobacterium sp.]